MWLHCYHPDTWRTWIRPESSSSWWWNGFKAWSWSGSDQFGDLQLPEQSEHQHLRTQTKVQRTIRGHILELSGPLMVRTAGVLRLETCSHDAWKKLWKPSKTNWWFQQDLLSFCCTELHWNHHQGPFICRAQLSNKVIQSTLQLQDTQIQQKQENQKQRTENTNPQAKATVQTRKIQKCKKWQKQNQTSTELRKVLWTLTSDPCSGQTARAGIGPRSPGDIEM